jgi:hypothetical protein
MPTTYCKAPADLTALIRRLVPLHPELHEVEARVSGLVAHPDESDADAGPPEKDDDGRESYLALKERSIPVCGTVKVVGQLQRAAGLADALVILDGFWWNHLDWSDRRKEAEVWKQLARLAVKRYKEGAVKSDDGGRPKLEIRPPTIFLAVDAAVLRRYGDVLPEARVLEELAQSWQQGELSFAEAASA